jgi:ribosome biogenesis GTPase / thiamine phosphate phosphatase
MLLSRLPPDRPFPVFADGPSMSKKRARKVRVAFRKNRENRARAKNLTHEALEQTETENENLVSDERISGKGDLTRHRTVIGVETDEDGTLQRAVDESACVAGRVLRSIGSNRCDVQPSQGRVYTCSVRRVVRTIARDARNAVVAGDRVLFQPLDEIEGVIERVEPRTSTISRGSGQFEHVIVANVDQALIVASAVDPSLKPGLIDRFLASAARGNVMPIIVINKADLADIVALQPIVGLYARLGYEILLASATTGGSVDRLRTLLVGRETVFAGQSGVGKTSLLNAIQPGLGRRTSGVSTDSGKGRHTTRVSELIALAAGGWVVDTPGVRQMELWDIIPEEVEGYFIEFRPFVARCRFPDCTHTHESGCRVKSAVVDGMISRIRYESYLRMRDE